MSNKKKIILHGHLADKYPHALELEAETVAEALQALQMIPELAPPPGQPWPVTVDGVTNEIALFSQTSMEEIHVRPMVSGGKSGGLFQVLLGIVLVAVSIIQPQFLAAAAQFMGGWGAVGMLGATMLLGGVLQMLMPTPQGYEDSESSKYLGANQNTVQIGTRIVLAYGNNRIGGHYLSFDVDAVDWTGEETHEGGVEGSTSSYISYEWDPILGYYIGIETGGEDPGSTTPSATGDLPVGEGVYVEYDKTPLDLVPVNPVFASPVASPTNIPYSAWNDI